MCTPHQRIEGVATQQHAFTEFRSTAPTQAIDALCTQTLEIRHRTRFIAGSGIEQSPRRSTTASMNYRGRVAQKFPDNCYDCVSPDASHWPLAAFSRRRCDLLHLSLAIV